MAFGFGTWDASGVDNNTGLVKINALAVMPIDATSNYNQTFSLPAGYSLDYLFQASGEQSGSVYINAGVRPSIGIDLRGGAGGVPW